MPITAFNEKGYLPEGVHICTMPEAEERFGHFQGSDRRVWLWSRFKEFIDKVRGVQIVSAIVLNGSFVTATAIPNDIDLMLVVRREHDFERDLTVTEYGVLSKVRVHRSMDSICSWRKKERLGLKSTWSSFSKCAWNREKRRV